jgi:hypothetical protein
LREELDDIALERLDLAEGKNLDHTGRRGLKECRAARL